MLTEQHPLMSDPTTKPTSKSEYLAWRVCPEEAWLDRHEPEAADPPTALDRLALEDGQLVDALAQDYFRKPGRDRELFGEPGTFTFQQRFEVPNRWVVICDVVFAPSSGGPATVIEVKASTAKFSRKGQLKPKPEHIFDLAYQRFTMRRTGYHVDGAGLLLLTGDYCLDESGLDLDCLFAYADVTEAVQAQAEVVAAQAAEVTYYLQGPEPSPWEYSVCGNKGKCRWMQRAIELPEYSIFDLSGAWRKHLQGLLDERVLDVNGVGDTSGLPAKLTRQIDVAQGSLRHCDQDAVNRMLGVLPYPHYFLDYETVATAVPQVDGMWPYQRLAFQYSLHIRRAAGHSPEHRECLLHDRTAGCLPLIEQLERDIAPTGGTVIVWNKAFEMGVNRDMAKTWPRHAAFLESVNARVFDLRDVFHSEAVEDPAMRGSSSIKKVLPALVPDMERAYAEMEINDGGRASYTWHQLVTGVFTDDDEVAAVRRDLLKYCELDTIAMVKLFDWAVRDTSATHPNLRF